MEHEIVGHVMFRKQREINIDIQLPSSLFLFVCISTPAYVIVLSIFRVMLHM